MTVNPYAPGNPESLFDTNRADLQNRSLRQSAWVAAKRGIWIAAFVGSALVLVPALAITAFGLGTGSVEGIVFFVPGVGFLVVFSVIGGLVAAPLGLIGALIRKAFQRPGKASAQPEADRPARGLASGRIGALSDDPEMPRNRRVLWPWLAIVPTLIALAAAFITGAAMARLVAGSSARAVEAADRDDPNWRWDDLLAHRQQVPDAENSALVMDEVLSMLPAGWMRTTKPLADEEGTQLGQVKELFRQLEATPANVRLSESAAESFRVELATYEEAVRLARTLAGYRRGRRGVENDRVVLETPLPETKEARVVARLLIIDASVRAHDGHPDDALDSCGAIFGVSRSIGDEPFLFAQFFRIAAGEVALTYIRRVLGQGEPSDGALAHLQAAIDDELAQPLLLTALRGERAVLTEKIRRVRDGAASAAALRDSLNSKFNPRLLPQARAPWRALWFEQQHAVTLDWMNQAVAIAHRPAAEQRSRWAAWHAKAQRAKESQFGKYIEMLPVLFSPAVESAGKSFSRYQAGLSATAILIAAERHRRKTGTWPASIAAIDRAILPSAPVDPFSGQPFLMKHRDGAIVIHSIGPNGKDEQGDYDPNHWSNGGPDDVGTAAWDVSLRRRPREPSDAVGGGQQPD